MTGLVVSFLLGAGAVVLTAPSGRLQRATGAPVHGALLGGILDGPLILDLLAAVLSAGASVERALLIVGEACDPRVGSVLTRVHAARLLGAPWDAAWDAGVAPDHAPTDLGPSGRSAFRWPAPQRPDPLPIIEEVRQGLRFGTATGAPSAALLHAHAAQLRRRRNRAVDREAAALGVRLVLPLGLCSLPAFICLGVVPVVLGLLPVL
ncbi:type II secretion system F family protein [Arthrobacter sp. TMS1-12-1]